MITVKIEDSTFQRRLKHIEESLGPAHLPRVLNDIGRALADGTRTRIAAGRDWQGRPFAHNTPVTLSRKSRTEPLIASGMFAAYRIFHHPAGTQVTIGATGVQAAVLQFGARKGQFGQGTTRRFLIPWGPIPPRPYMPLTDDGQHLVPAARQEVLTVIDEYLDAVGKRSQ